MRTWSFAKGHATANDFVVVADQGDLSAADVRFLCDRRRGIGADGVLRAVREADGWFMDYRNADGSIAEMCGNGLRLFATWLVAERLATGPVLDVTTRAGVRRAILREDGLVRVSMGVPTCTPFAVTVRLAGREWIGHGVNVGNPHCVVRIDPGSLGDLDLAGARPDDVNVEFVEQAGPGALRLRVAERGVGETASCGTGVVAACADARAAGGPASYTVDVRGGRLTVDFDAAGEAWLTGPAIIVARGEVTLP